MIEYTYSRRGSASTFGQKSASLCGSSTSSGFTLAELAIVLVIVGFLLGGMMVPLSAQRDIQNTNETQKQLSEIKEALFGFAAANGRLPCPASAAATGVESPSGGGVCVNPWDGFLPGKTLGIGPSDSQGYVVDSWGNRIRYAVTTQNSNAFTTSNGLRDAWGTNFTPDIRVCNTSAGISGAGATSACAANADLTSSAVAVITSSGKNGGVVPTGADEIANSDVNRTFVSHLPGPASAAQGEFDDIVVWLSQNILYSRMIAAGKLP